MTAELREIRRDGKLISCLLNSKENRHFPQMCRPRRCVPFHVSAPNGHAHCKTGNRHGVSSYSPLEGRKREQLGWNKKGRTLTVHWKGPDAPLKIMSQVSVKQGSCWLGKQLADPSELRRFDVCFCLVAQHCSVNHCKSLPVMPQCSHFPFVGHPQAHSLSVMEWGSCLTEALQTPLSSDFLQFQRFRQVVARSQGKQHEGAHRVPGRRRERDCWGKREMLPDKTG